MQHSRNEAAGAGKQENDAEYKRERACTHVGCSSIGSRLVNGSRRCATNLADVMRPARPFLCDSEHNVSRRRRCRQRGTLPDRTHLELMRIERRLHDQFGGREFYALMNETIARRERRKAGSTTKTG